MRALILLGIATLLGFTFVEDVPGRLNRGTCTPGAAFNAGRDYVLQTFNGSVELPADFQVRSHVRASGEGSYVIASWLVQTDRYGSSRKRPWSARVTTTAAGCRASGLRVGQ